MIANGLRKIMNLPRPFKRAISVMLDIMFISIAYWAAFYLKFGDLYLMSSAKHWLALIGLLGISLSCFVKLGLYRAVLRYVDYHAISVIAFGVLVPTIGLITIAYLLNLDLPIAVPIMYASWAGIFCGASRLMMRSLYQQYRKMKARNNNVIIYGAGESGRQLASSLVNGMEHNVVAFLDDSPQLQNTHVYGINIYNPKDLGQLQKKYRAKKLLMAMPCLSISQRRLVISGLPEIPMEIMTIPGMTDLVTGKAQISELKQISIEDLLGRDLVKPFPELISFNIFQKSVMVTGAGGSIGSEICLQVLKEKPEKIILYEQSEYALYKVEQTLANYKMLNQSDIQIIPILGSVTDTLRLESILSRYQIQTIYHAAAYKHVPLVEWNVVEGVRNNAFGTLTVAKAAVSYKVETFVLISTDKAVRPTNVMGASKRLAEHVCQALAAKQQTTKFCMVRFGNVLGSSGSVLPLMKKQIQNGGPVTVTHKDITRYFMAIREAAQLVIQAGAMSKGGDVFVLDMGKPIKIYDLAKKIISSMGLSVKSIENPTGDIEIQVTQLRPGEKLYEELLINEDDRPTKHPRICTTHEDFLPWDALEEVLQNLEIACMSSDQAQIRKILLNAKLAYQPNDPINDLVWLAAQKQTLAQSANQSKTVV